MMHGSTKLKPCIVEATKPGLHLQRPFWSSSSTANGPELHDAQSSGIKKGKQFLEEANASSDPRYTKWWMDVYAWDA